MTLSQEIIDLIQSSPSFSEEDKKKIFELLPSLDKNKQEALKKIFEQEKLKRRELAEQKSRAFEILKKIQAESKNKIRLKAHESVGKIEKKQKEQEFMEAEQLISNA